MNFDEFKNYILDNVKEKVGEDCTVTINKVMKNNGLELNGIVIMQKNQNTAPTIYLEEYFREYMCGKDMSELVQEIVNVYERHSSDVGFDFGFFLNYDTVKDKILFKVLNYKSNKKLLMDVPHKKYLDLAIVYYVLIDHSAFGTGAVMIHNNHVQMWNIDEEQLYEDAIVNTPKLLPYKFANIKNIMNEFKEENDFDETLSDLGIEECNMYILTNEKKSYGAGAFMYEGALDSIASQFNCNVYIIPSSVHEVIIMPIKKFDMTKDDINQMIKDINDSVVDPTEILGYHVYEYDLKKHALIM